VYTNTAVGITDSTAITSGVRGDAEALALERVTSVYESSSGRRRKVSDDATIVRLKQSYLFQTTADGFLERNRVSPLIDVTVIRHIFVVLWTFSLAPRTGTTVWSGVALKIQTRTRGEPGVVHGRRFKLVGDVNVQQFVTLSLLFRW
jgi:hypothetical protein